MSIEPHWVEIHGPLAAQIPDWARRVWIDENGEAFVPAALAGSETSILLTAAWDGVSLVTDADHVYLPLSWLTREYPQYARNWENIARKIKQFLGNE